MQLIAQYVPAPVYLAVLAVRRSPERSSAFGEHIIQTNAWRRRQRTKESLYEATEGGRISDAAGAGLVEATGSGGGRQAKSGRDAAAPDGRLDV